MLLLVMYTLHVTPLVGDDGGILHTFYVTFITWPCFSVLNCNPCNQAPLTE